MLLADGFKDPVLTLTRGQSVASMEGADEGIAPCRHWAKFGNARGVLLICSVAVARAR